MKNKENQKRTVSIILLFALIVIAINPFNVFAATKVKPKLSKTSLSIQQGTNYTLQLYNSSSSSVKWSSSNKKIATVTSKGKVKAVSPGTVTISAKYKSKTYKCKVTVKKFDVNYIEEDVCIIYNNWKIVKYTNNNDYDVKILINSKEYDEEGYLIRSSERYLFCLKDDSVYEDYSNNTKIEVIGIERVNNLDKTINEKIDITYDISNDEYKHINYYIQNKTDENIKCRFFIMVYDNNNNIVDCYRFIYSIPKNEKIKYVQKYATKYIALYNNIKIFITPYPNNN